MVVVMAVWPAFLAFLGNQNCNFSPLQEHVVGGVTQSGWGSDKADQRGWSTGYIARPQVPGAQEVGRAFCCTACASVVCMGLWFVAVLVWRSSGIFRRVVVAVS